jgi:hypothetical protein
VTIEYQIVNPGADLVNNSNLEDNTITFAWTVNDTTKSSIDCYCTSDEIKEDAYN